MSISLNPMTAAKLDHFRRRRRLILVARGVCAAVVVWLVAMLIVAMIDWAWVLPLTVRWTISAIGYAAAIAALWWVCLRRWDSATNRAGLASQVEYAEPGLRDLLLAAVELADRPADTAHGSPTFRALVQENVGRKMASLNIASLLPLRLVKQWLLMALGALALVAALLMLPGSPFRQLMTRAALPMANIDRVSRTKVEILQPTPHSLVVPRGETIAVVVATGGAGAEEAMLEITANGADTETLVMRRRDENEFEENLTVDAEFVDYRILAGDAVTRHYRIEAHRRPAVVAFSKTYRYPEYSQVPERTVVESDGNLAALEGTVVELRLEVDQPVSEASLLLQNAGEAEPQSIPLEQVEELVYSARIPLDRRAVYQVQLVSKKTGFENPFAPKYEIQPVPDLVPRVALVDPPPSPLLLPRSDFLRLQGVIEDELPLASVQHEMSVNGDPWRSVPLPVEQVPKLQVHWDADLATLDLRAGDRVSVRLVAVDLRGQRGETVPLQVLIAADNFDPDRHSVMQQRLALLRPLGRWTEQVAQLRAAMDAALEPIAANEGDEKQLAPPTAESLSRVGQMAVDVRTAGQTLLDEIRKTLPEMPAGADAAQLEWSGRAVDRILFDLAVLMRDWPSVDAQASPDPHAIPDPQSNADPAAERESARKQARQLKQQAASLGDLASRLAEAYHAFAAHSVVVAINRDLTAMLNHFQRLIVPGVPLPWERMLRQHAVSTTQLQAIENLIDTTSPSLEPSTQNPLRNLADWLSQQQTRLQQPMAGDEQVDALRQTTEQIARELEGRLHNVMLDGSLPGTINRGQQELHQRSGAVSRSIFDLIELARRAEASAKEATTIDDAEQIRGAHQRTAEQQATLREVAGLVQQRLRNQADIHAARPDGDSQFSADARLTERAIHAIVAPVPADSSEEGEAPKAPSAAAEDIAAALAILEAGHDAIQQRSELGTLISRERWDAMTVAGRIDHPQLWDQVQKQFELVANRLRDAKVPDPIRDAVARLQWPDPVPAIGEQLGRRRWDQSNISSTASHLQILRERLDQPIAELVPLMAEARKRLETYVPSVAELATSTADQLRELRRKTEQTAAEKAADEPQANDPSTAEATLSPEQLLAEEQRIRRQIDDLLQSLTDDANTQDMLTEEGRERARDADDAIQMIAPPANAMHESMQQAVDSRDSRTAEKLTESARHQSETADRLEQVAEHFERLDAGDDATETRQALRDAERQLGLAREMQHAYDQVQQLAGTLEQDPRSLLEQLERELQRNPEMQSALSDIAADAAQDAQHALERSAEAEATMRRQIEQADEAFRHRKRMLADDLKDLAEAASITASQLADPARSLAADGKANDAQQVLQEARDQLNRAAEMARSASPETVLEDLHTAAQQASEAANKAAEHLQQAELQTAEAKAEAIYENDRDLANKKRDTENRQRQLKEGRLREARQQKQRLDQQQNQANNETQQADRAKNDRQRDLEKAEQELQKKPDETWRKDAVQQARERQQQAEAALARAEEYQRHTEQRKTTAEQHLQSVEQTSTPELAQKNPSAELAERLAHQAREVSERIARTADELAKAAEFSETLQGDAGQLANAAKDQQRVQTDVERVSQNLARASRHEQRMDNADAAKVLGDAAEKVSQVAKGQVAQADQRLSEVAQAVQPAEGETDQQPLSGADRNTAVQTASGSVAAAQEALSEQADSLGKVLAADATARAQKEALAMSEEGGATTGSEAPSGSPGTPPQPQDGQSQNGQSQSGQPQSGQPQSGQSESGSVGGAATDSAAATVDAPANPLVLARTLDELDRALYAAPTEAASAEAQQSSAAFQQAAQHAAAQSSPAAAAAPTLAALAQASARRMAMSRSRARAEASQSASNPTGTEPANGPGAGTASPDALDLEAAHRADADDWGQLRERRAEDVGEGQRNSVSARYQRQVEAYFRALAERSQSEQPQ